MFFTPLLQGAAQQQAGAGQWQLVAKAAFTSTAFATTASSPAFAVSVGQLIVVAYGWESNEEGTPSIADSAGNTYTALTRYTSAGPQWIRLFYSVATSASASNVVTVTTASVNYRNLTVQVFQPPPGTVSLDTSFGGAASAVVNLTGVNVDPVTNGSSLVTFSSKIFNNGTYDPSEIGWQETDATNYFISAFQNVSNGDPRPVGVKRTGGSTQYVYAWASFTVTQAAAPGLLTRKIKWNRQPQGPVEIDWSNPLTQGLVVETGGHRYHGARLIDGTVNQSTNTGAGVSLAHTRYGKALSFNGSQANGAASFGDVDRGDGYSASTWHVVWKSGAGKVFGKWGGSGSEQSWLIELGTGGADFIWVVATSGGFTWFSGTGVFSTTDWNNAVFVWRGGTGTANVSLIVNGVDKSSSLTVLGSGGTTQINGTGNLQIGVAGDGGPITGQVAVARMWKRALSLSEARALSLDPSAILKPASRTFALSAPQVSAVTPTVFRQRLHWTRQPQGAVEVDWSNPITRGLVNAYNFATSNRDIANSVQGAVTDVNTVGVGFSGQLRGLSTNDSLRSISDPTGKMLTTGACTHLAIVRLTAVDSPWGGIFSVSDAFSNAVAAIQRRNSLDSIAVFRSNFEEMTFSTTVTSLTDGNVKALALRFTGAGTNSCSFFVNGVAQTATNAGSATATPASGAVSLRLMAERSASATTNSNGNYFAHLIWNRALTASEIASISANPWQIFKPVTRTITGSAVISSVTIYRPTSDIVTTGWTASSGSVLYDMVDEVTPSDADYIVSPSLSGTPGAVTFGISSMPAGSYTVSLRARETAPDGEVRVVMKDAGGTSVGASSWQALSLSFTTYTLAVTTTGTATQLSIEVR